MTTPNLETLLLNSRSMKQSLQSVGSLWGLKVELDVV